MTEQVTAPTPLLTGPVAALVAQGAKRAVLGDRTYDYRAGQYLVVSVDLPVTGNYTQASGRGAVRRGTRSPSTPGRVVGYELVFDVLDGVRCGAARWSAVFAGNRDRCLVVIR